MHLDLVLEKASKINLTERSVRKDLEEIARAGCVAKLHVEARVLNEPRHEQLADGHRLEAAIRLEKHRFNDPENARQHLLRAAGKARRAAETRDRGWRIKETIPGEVVVENIPAVAPAAVSRPPFIVPPLTPEVLATFFGGIYERDNQILTIHRAVEMCVETDGEISNHVLLYGLPGSCKTVLTEKLEVWYQQAGGLVKPIDATTMTEAGIMNWLIAQAEANTLPDVLVLDEIEKKNPEQLLGMLGIMGSGVLRRLNTRVGDVRRKVRFLVIGICNDEQKVKDWMGGALWSRFAHQLPCVRPSRELCEKILLDLLTKIPNGNSDWISKVMEFGWDELGEEDIRKLKRHLNGRDGLLDGSWQAAQSAMIEAKKREDRLLSEARRRLS